jgi:hypothetical protein
MKAFGEGEGVAQGLASEIQKGDPALVDALISREPLHKAAREGNMALAQKLVGMGALVNAVLTRREARYTPLDQARAAGQSAVATWLESVGGVDAPSAPQEPIELVVVASDLKKFSAPVDQDQDEGMGEKLAEHWSQKGMSNLPRHKKMASAMFNESYETAKWLKAAILTGDADFIDALSSFEPLQKAAREGNMGLAKSLVEFGALVNARGVSGKTALDEAQEAGHGELEQWLGGLGALGAVGLADKERLEAQAQEERQSMDGVLRVMEASVAPRVAVTKVVKRQLEILETTKDEPERWSERDDAFWRGDAKAFKQLNSVIRASRAARGGNPSALDQACDQGDVARLKELLGARRERLGMDDAALAKARQPQVDAVEKSVEIQKRRVISVPKKEKIAPSVMGSKPKR